MRDLEPTVEVSLREYQALPEVPETSKYYPVGTMWKIAFRNKETGEIARYILKMLKTDTGVSIGTFRAILTDKKTRRK